MPKQKLVLAGRKWRRQFADAVLVSISKTLTEPITNAYDSFKRIWGKADATTGLVEAILAVPVGSHVIHEELVGRLATRPAREIIISLSRTEKHGAQRKECVVIDSAEGMTEAELGDKFAKYGADKSGASAGHAVRGLFGQGICDVVYSHPPGTIRSIKNEIAAECVFTWGAPPDEVPEYEVKNHGRATKKLRRDWRLANGNGTAVSFVLAEKCRLPHSPEALVAKVSNFYMLRLINSDPATDVMLHQVRRGATESAKLKYFFPRGQVIKVFEAKIKYADFAPIIAQGTIVRSETALPGYDAGDDRATGLLIVDENDAVYDQTFFRSDNSPYLDHLYGIVRLAGVREILRKRLEEGEALLTESRDGFDRKKDLYRAIDEALNPILEPVLRKEIERRSEPSKGLSKSAEKKLKKAFEKLNDLFEDVTKEQTPVSGDGGGAERLPETIAFEEERIQLRVGVARRIRLLGNAGHIKADSIVVMDSTSPDVKVEPTSTSWSVHPKIGNLLVVSATVTAEKLGQTARIQALAQDTLGGIVEAVLEVTDVVPPLLIDPPADGIEFSPRSSTTAPSRRGGLALVINAGMVPLGTEIQIVKSAGDKPVKLVDDNGVDQETLMIVFASNHLLPGDKLGRVSLGYRGYGFGQRAVFTANCFVRKQNYRAEAFVRIEETKSPSGGVFKDVNYADLPLGMKRRSSEFDPTTGVITINRLHPINRAAFGTDGASFAAAIDKEPHSQWRYAEVIVDQCLFHTAAVAYQNSQLLIPQEDVIGGIRKWIEQYKYDNGEGVFRELVGDFRVPRLEVGSTP